MKISTGKTLLLSALILLGGCSGGGSRSLIEPGLIESRSYFVSINDTLHGIYHFRAKAVESRRSELDSIFTNEKIELTNSVDYSYNPELIHNVSWYNNAGEINYSRLYSFNAESGKPSEAEFHTETNSITRQKDIELIETGDGRGGGLLLFPKIFHNDEGMMIGADAFRVKIVEGEYQPDSESFRIEVMSQKGAIVYSSSYDKNFLQVIGDVEPLSPGEWHSYALPWDSTNNDGKKLSPGVYTIKITIPAFPGSYSETLRFYLNG
ncbi:MAG: BsuPI-related putative proteinase inhibitor [Candidatus Kapaibacterium sp.]